MTALRFGALTPLLLVLGACATDGVSPSAPLDLPDHVAPAEALTALDLLEGRWVAVNPNGTMNEEVWLPVRGNVVLGLFRQVRLDGDCAFVEVSQIAREGDEVILRLRHLHGRLEVPGSRADVSEFELVSLTDDRVEFAGAGATADVTAVVYERRGPDELVQSLFFDPETGQQPFVTEYRLDRSAAR